MKVPTCHRSRASLRYFLFGAFACVLLLACSKKKDAGHGKAADKHVTSMSQLYGLSSVPTFDVTLSDEAYAALQKAPRTWVRGDFHYEAESFAGVSIRIKGHRSLRSIDDKPSLKIRFDKGKANKARRFLGVRRLTLNNLVEDGTMIREYLGYRLARAVGLPVPKAGFAQIRLNGAPYGLYLILESVDQDFLARNFGSGAGQLYEGEYGCDLYEADVPGFEQDSGDQSNRDALRHFAKAATGSDGQLWKGPSSPLSLNHLATFLAFSTFVGDFDGYHHSHNYRIYQPSQGAKWNLMSWGLDRSFFKKLLPYSSKGLLAKRCFADLECRVAYLLALRSIDSEASKLNLATGSKVISSIIADAVSADNKRPYKDKRMRRLRQRLRNFLAERSADVAEYSACLDAQGREQDLDKDGYACMDCDDSNASIYPGAPELCDGIDNDCSGLADDVASCPCPMQSVANTRYAMCNLPMPWQAASSHCQALGGKLATVDTLEVGAALHTLAQQALEDKWWVGGTDSPVEGDFRWQGGGTIGKAMWGKGQPDNMACNQDCVALSEGGKGALHDTHCGQHRPFICQFE